MPDPSNYDNQSDWMSACVPAVMDEGRTNEQAVAQCISMWDNKEEDIFAGVIFGRKNKDVFKGVIFKYE